MAQAYQLIQAITVGAGGAASIDFTNIPSNYTDLCIKFSGRNAGNYYTFSMKVNGSSVTSAIRCYGVGSSTTVSSDTYNGFYTNYSTLTASTFGSTEIYIPNYTSANIKSFSVEAVSETNATACYMNLASAVYSTSSAISSFSLIPESGNFAQYTTAYIYGISNS